MEFTTIIYEVSHRIATVTLNRPEARNAFTLTMADELNAALLAADRDDSVRVVILRAAGEHFCVGMDMTDGGNRRWETRTILTGMSPPPGSRDP